MRALWQSTTLVTLLASGCDLVFSIDGQGAVVDAVGGDAQLLIDATGDAVDAGPIDAAPLIGAGRWMRQEVVARGEVGFGIIGDPEGAAVLDLDGTRYLLATVAGRLRMVPQAQPDGTVTEFSTASPLFPPSADLAYSSAPRVTADGTIYYVAGPSSPEAKLHRAKWTGVSFDVQVLGATPGYTDQRWLMPCDGGRAVVALANGGDHDLFELPDINDTNVVVPLEPVNSTAEDTAPWISADCRELYFASDQALGDFSIYYSARVTLADEWSAPVQVLGLSAFGRESEPLLLNSNEMYLTVDENTLPVIVRATRIP